MSTQEKTIYDLKLHEAIMVTVAITDKGTTTMLITRVPGGFLYINEDMTLQTFVPFDDEFNSNKSHGFDDL